MMNLLPPQTSSRATTATRSVTDTVSSATNWINATVRDAMMLENQLALRHPAEQAARCERGREARE